jgi:mono/diheme cytochrome c family protein
MRFGFRTLHRHAPTAALAAAAMTFAAACGSSSPGAGHSSSAGGVTASTAGPSTSTRGPSATTPAGGSAAHSSSAGLKVFTSAGCGSCHTLAAAHATGDVGPNLDDVKPPEAEVATQVADGGGAMPSYAGKLTQAQITAVAKFVASAGH